MLLEELEADTSSREIPISSVVIIEGAYPRLSINMERVNMFRELFKYIPNEIPPIKIVPVADIDEIPEQYIAIDGRHRLLGRQFSSDSILADIFNGMRFAPGEIDTPETKRKIRLLSYCCNLRHGTAFSKEELGNNIIELYLLNTPLEELCALAPEKTVRRLLKNMQKPAEEEKAKDKIAKLKASGLTQPGVSFTMDSAQEKAQKKKRINSEKSGQQKNREKKEEKTSRETYMTSGSQRRWTERTEYGPAQAEFCDSADAIEKIYNAVREMKFSKKSEQNIKLYLIPLLAEKFPAVRNLIENSGYAAENEVLVSERRSLIKQISDVGRKLEDMAADKTRLQSELNARRYYCKRQCRFSREQYIKEQKNFLDSMLEDIGDLKLYLHVLRAVEKRLSEKQDSDFNKKVLSEIESLFSQKKFKKKEFNERLEKYAEDCHITPYIDRKHDASLESEIFACRVMRLNQIVLTSVALNLIYKFLSTLDYCIQLKHNPEDLRERLAELKQIIHKSGIYSEDLEKRIKEYNNTLAD